MTVLADLLVIAGVAFVALATLGLIRLPDVYTRAHAVAKAETLGVGLVVIGLALRPEADADVVVRLVLLLGFAFVGNPTAVHAITRAARRAGVQPWHADSHAEPVVTGSTDAAPADDHPDAATSHDPRSEPPP